MAKGEFGGAVDPSVLKRIAPALSTDVVATVAGKCIWDKLHGGFKLDGVVTMRIDIMIEFGGGSIEAGPDTSLIFSLT